MQTNITVLREEPKHVVELEVEEENSEEKQLEKASPHIWNAKQSLHHQCSHQRALWSVATTSLRHHRSTTALRKGDATPFQACHENIKNEKYLLNFIIIL